MCSSKIARNRMKRWILGFSLITAALILAACGRSTPTTAADSTLTVMTHDSFSVSEAVIAAFEEENNVTVLFIKAGDTGAALNRAILTKNNPEADVFFGVDNTFLSRAIQEQIFEPYTPDALAKVPDEFSDGTLGTVTPISYGDVCINYDKAWFAESGLAVPQTLSDLSKPDYQARDGAALLVVQNPATSSPGLAFLLATISEYGEAGYLDFWQALKSNGVVVVNDWETAYYTNFSASSGRGAQPMVVSYASSPVAEVIFAEQPLAETPTGSIIEGNSCFRQVEFAGVLKGAKHPEMAQRFIDFMLSPAFQEDMPLQMFVYPVNPEAVLPDAFIRFAMVPEEPATLDSVLIANKREEWIAAWSRLMLP